MARGRKFVTYDMWRLGRPGEDAPNGFIIKQIRVSILLFREFMQDTLMLRAAALTFFTILSIVPFLALQLFIIQTLEIDDQVFEAINERVVAFLDREEETAPPDPGEQPPLDVTRSTAALAPKLETEGAPELETEPDVLDDLFRVARDTFTMRVAQADETRAGERLQDPVETLIALVQRGAENQGAVSAVSIVLFLMTVFGLMANIERSFNHIWGVKAGRSWYRKFSDYLVVTFVLPYLAAAVLGVSAALQSEAVVERLGPVAFAIGGVQLLVIWLVFFALYKAVPNTHVKTRYAVLGAVVAGIIWYLTSLAYVKFQIGLVGYNIIYSTVAQFPMLLMWVYLSWLILLFGAELSFAYQNEKTFFMEHISQNASYAYRESLGIRAMLEIGHRFEKGIQGLSVDHGSDEWRVPTSLLNDVLQTLHEFGLVTRCDSTPVTYQPGRSLSRITVGDVIEALREHGRDPSLLREEQYFQPLFQELSSGNRMLMSTTLDELAQQYGNPPKLLESQESVVVLEEADEEDEEDTVDDEGN